MKLSLVYWHFSPGGFINHRWGLIFVQWLHHSSWRVCHATFPRTLAFSFVFHLFFLSCSSSSMHKLFTIAHWPLCAGWKGVAHRGDRREEQSRIDVKHLVWKLSKQIMYIPNKWEGVLQYKWTILFYLGRSMRPSWLLSTMQSTSQPPRCMKH